MNLRLRFLFLSSIFFTSLFAQQTASPLRFKHLTTKDGLTGRHILYIHQDRKGFIWIGTTDGLQRYDGRNFKTFLHDTRDSNSLTHNQIHCLKDDPLGKLWITTNHGLTVYDPGAERFYRFSSSTDKRLSKNSDVQHDILVDRRGERAWIATNDGLLEFSTVNLKWQLHKVPPMTELLSFLAIDEKYLLLNRSSTLT